ncbi:MAG: ATP-dependent Clp protease proteolytic subunit [Phycisphaerae bacterium]|nr:ATP-dependent Clp protease proteolytic subunit [Phycisphaerae bacterium]
MNYLWQSDGDTRPRIQYRHTDDRDRRTIAQHLLDNRIIYLGYPIVPEVTEWVIGALLFLQADKKDQDIHLYINSLGGYVDQTLAIYDTMTFLSCNVATYCIGTAASGAALLLAAGSPGKRYALPNSKMMLHQPMGGISGQAEDIRIQAEEIIKDKKRLIDILVKHTGQDRDKIAAETERDHYMDAQEAKGYGLVDEILDNEPKAKKAKTADKSAEKDKPSDK